MEQKSNIISRWFARERGGGLILPDGWYGRPYDNLHALTEINVIGDCINLILDNRLTLSIENPESIIDSGAKLQIRDFIRASFAAIDSVTGNNLLRKEFGAGTVEFVSSSG